MIAGTAVGCIAAIFIAFSLYYFYPYLDALEEFHRRNVPSAPHYEVCDDTCIRNIGMLEQEMINFALGGILLGFLSAGLSFFHAKFVTVGILISIAAFISYGYVTDSTLCDLPDDRGLWDPAPVCNIYNYIGPIFLVTIGISIIVLGIRSRRTSPIQTL